MVQISPHTGKHQLAIIDTGIAHSMSNVDRVNFIEVFFAFIRKDGHHLGEIMVDRSRDPSKCVDRDHFAASMEVLVNELNRSGLDTGHVGIGKLMRDVFSLCYMHQVKLESHYAAFIISVSILEGLIRQLDPNIDVLDKAVPYIRRAAVKELWNYSTSKSSLVNK